MLFAKRLREHLVLFGAVLGVVGLLSGLGLGIVGALTHATTQGVRDELATRAGSDLGLRATLTLDADPDRQDEEVRAAIARSFQSDGEPIPLSVDRTVAGLAFAQVATPAVAGPGVERKVEVLSVPDFPERATLVDGAWGTAPDEVAVQATAAAELGIAVGDTFLLGKVPVRLAATWLIGDYLDPRWLGDTLLVSGVEDTGLGPVIVDEALFASLDSSPRAQWTIVPDPDRITAAQLAATVPAWEGVRQDWRGQIASDLTSLEQQGRFKRTALELGIRVDGLRAIEPVALLLLVAIGLVTLVELARLLTTTRADEIALLWSRGASALDIARTTALETAVAALIGAGLGAGAAVGALVIGGASDAIASLAGVVIAVPLGVSLIAVLAFTLSALRSARRQTVRDPSDRAGRARRLAGPGLLVLVGGAAALSIWQLRLYGSPVTPTEAGGSAIDPIAVVAPALGLVAVVLAALVLFPVLAGLEERIGRRVGRRVGITQLLAARTVARDLALVAAPIVVVAVTCAALVVAAGYAATWSDAFTRTNALRTGSDVHVAARDGLSTPTIDAIDGLPEVTSIAPLELQDLQLGTDAGSIVAVTPEALERSASASDAIDRAGMADAMATDVPGPRLDADADDVELTVSTKGFAIPPTVTMWISDASGVLRALPTEATDSTYTADLAAGLGDTGPWQILAIDVEMDKDAVSEDGSGTFVMTALTTVSGDARTDVELPDFWIPESPSLQFDPPVPSSGGPGFVVTSSTLKARLTPSFDGSITDRLTAPVVISQRVADLYDLGVGDSLAFFLSDSYEKLSTTVAMIVPAIPTAPLESAVLIDLRVVQHFQLRVTDSPALPRDLWVATEDQESVAAALRPELPANAFISTSDDASGRVVLGSAALALWWAAAGCLLLAAIAMVAVTRAQLRSRVLEVVVLRTIGLGSRDQSALRRRELAIVLGYGAVAGLVAGGAVVLLTVSQLASAAIPDPYPTLSTPVAVDLLGLAVGLALIAVVLVVTVVVYAARVGAQARSSTGAEEVR